jgi:hypothetical protein
MPLVKRKSLCDYSVIFVWLIVQLCFVFCFVVLNMFVFVVLIVVLIVVVVVVNFLLIAHYDSFTC